MAVQIPVPQSSYEEIEISLSGKTYHFVFRFNERLKKDSTDTGTWMIDIYSSTRQPLIMGLAVVDQNYLISPVVVEGFDLGDILCYRSRKTELSPGRNNVGFDKEYQLIYLTHLEIESA